MVWSNSFSHLNSIKWITLFWKCNLIILKEETSGSLIAQHGRLLSDEALNCVSHIYIFMLWLVVSIGHFGLLFGSFLLTRVYPVFNPSFCLRHINHRWRSATIHTNNTPRHKLVITLPFLCTDSRMWMLSFNFLSITFPWHIFVYKLE